MAFYYSKEVEQKIWADHHLTREEVDSVVNNIEAGWEVSRTTGRPEMHGFTHTGRYIVVVLEDLETEGDFDIVTAFEPDDTVLPLDDRTKRRQRWKRRKAHRKE